MKLPRIASIHMGRIAPLGPDKVPSAYVKSQVEQSVEVTTLGMRGDDQADLSVHGGIDKAVYGYSLENYNAWLKEYPQHESILRPGAFGENLCIEALRENDLCVGDIHRIGRSRLQVCQPRQPCFKLALYFEDKRMPKAMVRSGRSGWYYRVVETGTIAPNDSVRLDERPNPDFPFSRLVELVSRNTASRDELEKMQVMPGLATQWQEWAQSLLRQ
jgi:MOSC domain-containing protein YiiM